jgi:integrase
MLPLPFGDVRQAGPGSNTYLDLKSDRVCMDKLQWDLTKLCNAHRTKSYSTQEARRRSLDLTARELKMLGYRDMRASSLKPKHVEALVKYWEEKGIEVGTVKNRMAHLRWWARQIGNPSVIPNENKTLGIPERKYVAESGKQIGLSEEQLGKLGEERIRVCLLLESAFGLRREEALKFRPEYALRGADPATADRIHLKGSWCKGKRPREVPIRHDHQRELLAWARRVAGNGSMIPPERSYVQQLKIYEAQLTQAGIANAHGLRHGYAQRRYEELTGWPAPHKDGPRSKELTPDQKALDQEARMTVSAELGHGREEITAVYLGR